MGAATPDQQPTGDRVTLPSGRSFIPDLEPKRPLPKQQQKAWDGLSHQWRSVKDIARHGGAKNNVILRETFYLEQEGRIEVKNGQQGSLMMRWKSPQAASVPSSPDTSATAPLWVGLSDIPEINQAMEESALLQAIGAEKAARRLAAEAVSATSYDEERVAKLETQVADLQTKLARTNAALQAALSGGE